MEQEKNMIVEHLKDHFFNALTKEEHLEKIKEGT